MEIVVNVLVWGWLTTVVYIGFTTKAVTQESESLGG